MTTIRMQLRLSPVVLFVFALGLLRCLMQHASNMVAGHDADALPCADTDTAAASQMEDSMGDLFDHIEDLLDFPSDDVLGLAESCAPLLLPHLPEPIVADGLLGGAGGAGEDSLDGFLCGVGEDSLDGSSSQDNKRGAAFSPEEDKLGSCDELDIVQLEWMSKFLDDSDSFGLDLPSGDVITNSTNNANSSDDNNTAEIKAKDHSFFRTSSPVSVLEANGSGSGNGSSSDSSSYSSSSSSSTSASASYFIGGNKDARLLLPPCSPPEQPSVLVVPARARSKRPRPATFSPRPHVTIPYLPPSSDVVAAPLQLPPAASEPESIGECSPPPLPPKKKKSKKKAPAAPGADGEEPGSPQLVRKCMHCEIQKTPQWRAGPMGPKTLCNACGVRYKSGRLFPEYRPAASPTFAPSIHSNSHKKVVEMRNKATTAGAAMSSSDGCDLLEYIRRQE